MMSTVEVVLAHFYALKGTNEEGVAGVKRHSNDCCQGNEDEDDVWEQMEMVAEDREPVAKSILQLSLK